MNSQCLERKVVGMRFVPGSARDALVVENERLRAEHHAARRQAALCEAQARDALQGKQDMLDSIGDELRNPLAAMALSLGRLKERGGRTDPDRLCTILARQVERLGALVGELIDASRASRGHVALDRRRIEVGAL